MPATSASFSRRLSAYILDVLLFALIIVAVAQVIPEPEKIELLEAQILLTNENMIREVIDTKTYIVQYAELSHELDRLNINYSIFNLGYIFAYFIVIPLFFGAQTLGMRVFKIKIISVDGSKFTFWDLFIRNLISNALVLLLCSTILVWLIPPVPYYVMVTILVGIQISLVFISGIMILYKKDKRGLQDIITGTRVIKE